MYYDRANQLLEEAGKISLAKQQIPMLLAKNYLLQSKDQEAIQVLEKLVAADPGYNEPHWFLGLALVKSGQEDRGIEELERGFIFGKTYKNNILYLIDLYAGRKEYNKIILLYKDLINSEPNNAQLYASLAATYAMMGDEANVIVSLNKAIELQPELAGEATSFLKKNGIDVEKYK